MNEETKTIITPIDKHEVVLKLYISGRENRELKGVFLENMSFQLEGTDNKTITKSDKINMAELTAKAEDRAIEIIVVSINGETENFVDKVLDMKNLDAQFVKKEINKITEGEDFLE